jgi:para-aminobenzoate synthetase component 1
MFQKTLPYIKDTTKWFEKIKHFRHPVFFDSCYTHLTKAIPHARFDILVFNPFIEIKSQGKKTYVKKDNIEFLSDESLISVVDSIYDQYRVDKKSDLPFIGGFVGFMSYEAMDSKNKKNNLIPKEIICAYDKAIVVDHKKKETFFISVLNEDPETFQKLNDNVETHVSSDLPFSIEKIKSNNDLEFKDYASKFNIVMNHINNGDVYQVNLAKKYSVKYEGSEWDFYKKFRKFNQSSYMVYADYEDFIIASGSPEQFIEVNNGIVTSRPIKGTIKRESDPEQDRAQINKLKESEKDHAENLMIVDLIRNDIGKDCVTGSVVVEKLFEVETYPNVHHLVSKISGKINPTSTPFKLFVNAFPGGSITGAPKIKAMEIIDNLESFPREIYCGSLFYYSFDGNFNSNIGIRSIFFHEHTMHYFSGGGITKYSDVNEEFDEIGQKAKNIEKTINSFKD